MVEARELVADAALGPAHALWINGAAKQGEDPQVEQLWTPSSSSPCFDDSSAVVLYHHLLCCGLRLAATAGTDTFLSFARGPAPASNPPGWGRVYAQLGGAPLTMAAFAEAVRPAVRS